MPITESHEAVQFLKAIFEPEDLILFRPIEIYLEAGKKRSRVDYDGIRYERFGARPGADHPWAWHDSRMASVLQGVIDRTETTLANLFFGVCPRLGAAGQFDQAWQIRTVRALWSDIDDAKPAEAVARCKSAGLPIPSVIVASGHGSHLYWLLEHPAEINDADPPPAVFTEFLDAGLEKPKKRQLYLIDPHTKERLSLDARQNVPGLSVKAQHIQDTIAGIAGKVGGDHTTDLSRILRLPGTLNRKDQRNGQVPTQCVLDEINDGRYPLEAFASLAASSPSRVLRQRVAQVPLPKKRPMNLKRQTRLDSLLAMCAAAETGRRSEADYAVCCYAVEVGMDADQAWQAVCGVGKFAEAGRRYFEITWSAAKQHTREKILHEAQDKAGKRKAQADKAKQRADGGDHGQEIPEADDDPHRLARMNLERYAENGRTLKYWRDEWYAWKSRANCYRKITSNELRAKLSLSIKEEFDRIAVAKQDEGAGGDEPIVSQKVTMALVSNVLQATSGMTVLSSHIEPGTWIPDRSRRLYVSMANGLLDIEAVLANESLEKCMRENTPDWFSTVSLPYSFDPEAACPKWEAFLRYSMEDDPERKAVLQEWAGYLLTPSTDEQKFMILAGEGGNGKSVFIAGITGMLGIDNTATVPLEMFGQRFALTSTLGKLLNACGDAGEIEKADEGNIKAFTSGNQMTFDRKNLPPVDAVPTARLMIACNNLPRWSDRSQGIWRRLIPIPWNVQVPKEKRIKGMDKSTWWLKQGELPGILNWAIHGLFRLRSQNCFTESAAVTEALDDYQDEVNPARVFLKTFLEKSACRIKSNHVYSHYVRWVKQQGSHPLNERSFGKEIKRAFPSASRLKCGGREERYWCYDGIGYAVDAIAGEEIEQKDLF